MPGQPGDLFYGHARFGHDRDERVPQLPRRPDALDARFRAQRPEVKQDVRRVQWRTHAGREHQAGIQPWLPGGQAGLRLPLAVLT